MGIRLAGAATSYCRAAARGAPWAAKENGMSDPKQARKDKDARPAPGDMREGALAPVDDRARKQR
jgi:hypothetical protein